MWTKKVSNYDAHNVLTKNNYYFSFISLSYVDYFFAQGIRFFKILLFVYDFFLLFYSFLIS